MVGSAEKESAMIRRIRAASSTIRTRAFFCMCVPSSRATSMPGTAHGAYSAKLQQQGKLSSRRHVCGRERDIQKLDGVQRSDKALTLTALAVSAYIRAPP